MDDAKAINSCTSCKARFKCSTVTEPGSIACMVHLLQMGITQAIGDPYQTSGTPKFCPYCGKPLKIIEDARFCENPQCANRFKLM